MQRGRTVHHQNVFGRGVLQRCCSGVESCNLEGTRGVCTARTLGKSCQSDAQCLEGTCERGVCCRTACHGVCMTCNGTQPGTCTQVPDNEDPYLECDLPCGACVRGRCMSTAPGTDPHNQCGAGMACGVGGVCLAAGGGACTDDNGCAVGRCVGGLCLRTVVEELVSPRLNPAAFATRLLAFDVDSSGEAHALVRQTLGAPLQAPWEKNLYLLHRRGGAWTGTLLRARDRCDVKDDAPTFGISHVGRLPFVAFLDAPDTVNEDCSGEPFPDGHAYVQWLEEDGTPRVDTQVPDPIGGPLAAGWWLRTAYDGEDTFFVAYNATVNSNSNIYLSRFRLSDATFPQGTQTMGSADTAAHGDLVVVNQTPVVLTSDSSTELVAMWPDGAGTFLRDSTSLAGCGIWRVSAAVALDGAVLWAADCRQADGQVRGRRPLLGTFDPRRAQGERFQLVALASEPEAMATTPLVLTSGTQLHVVAARGQPVSLWTGVPPGTRQHSLGQPVPADHNVFSLWRGAVGDLAYVAWTEDQTMGFTWEDNALTQSSRVFWARLAP